MNFQKRPNNHRLYQQRNKYATHINLTFRQPASRYLCRIFASGKFVPMMLPSPEWYAVLDSTNSYLLQKLETQPALPSGTTVCTQHQTAGRGQRQKPWMDTPGKSLLFSVAVQPVAELAEQPLFCFGIAVAVAETLKAFIPDLPLQLKWPNDLYVNNGKLGGILIENILRGSRWQWAVIGIGINLLPQPFDASFRPAPAFLAQLTDQLPLPEPLAQALQTSLTAFSTHPLAPDLLTRYNQQLYRKGCLQTFETAGVRWQGIVQEALPDGRLLLLENGRERTCVHGTDLWIPEPNASGTTSAA
ncbi:MAG: biotin--[acetyl-CoA-carboxylase] ligase [Sphingobacteriales bacterium]|nr:MAG: biotin--[acetyl-CoA-carboxylase] ligase [Sphingobacteriales bacterium]